MAKKNGKNSIFGGLFLRTYLSFAGVIAVFAIILGVLFMRLYEKAVISDYENEIQLRTEKFSKKCSEMYLKGRSKDFMDIFHKALADINDYKISFWQNKDSSKPLSFGEDIDNSPEINHDYLDAIIGSFSGETRLVIRKANNRIACAAPIYGEEDENGHAEVIGAVLLQDNLGTDPTDIGVRLIFISLLVALVVTAIIAVPVIGMITTPISTIRYTAFSLADGDYTVKTGIDRKDEIGQLASTVDFLADKLAENEKERQSIEQMRRDFFANVSHELRTPITVVRAYAESLNDGVVTNPEKVSQYYARILNECVNMERLVGDLLTLSKMQNPDFEIEKEPVDLQQVFIELLRMGKTLADEKNVNLKYSAPDAPCVMMADYGRLRQMFIVILDNAVKFSNEGGNVYLGLKRSGDDIVCSIRDEGIGIPEEDLPLIFEKFFKSKTRQNAKGSGLGLAIANQICKKHGGTIKVESEKGKGTCFTFTFTNVEEIRQ